MQNCIAWSRGLGVIGGCALALGAQTWRRQVGSQEGLREGWLKRPHVGLLPCALWQSNHLNYRLRLRRNLERTVCS